MSVSSDKHERHKVQATVLAAKTWRWSLLNYSLHSQVRGGLLQLARAPGGTMLMRIILGLYTSKLIRWFDTASVPVTLPGPKVSAYVTNRRCGDHLILQQI